MFAISRPPIYDFNTLFHTLDSVNQYQRQQALQQRESSRPRVVKKVETEDKYQIQIFKKYGNFDSYEVKVLRGVTHGNTRLINLVIESQRDDFRRVFQFNLDDIVVKEIDWEYYKSDNVLVLNVPKRAKYCSDDYVNSLLAGFLGLPVASENSESTSGTALCRHGATKERKHKHKRERRHSNRDSNADAAAVRAEVARQKASKHKKDSLAKEERAKEKAQRVAEKKAKRAELKERKAAKAAADEKQRQKEEQASKQEEFSRALFGGFLPGFRFISPQSDSVFRPEREANSQPPQEPSSHSLNNPKEELQKEETYSSHSESEAESVQSDISITDSRKRGGDSIPGSPQKVPRSPSLEEIEDEEFVMFRKKFGKE